MKLRIVETSLNLRIERGKDRSDYVLSKEVANKQLELNGEIYCNVEWMECANSAYIEAFEEAGYTLYSAVDEPRRRGILYAVKKEFEVEEVTHMQEPHMYHIRVKKADMCVADIITLRILVGGSNDRDYISRRVQWEKVMQYIDTLNKEHLILTGDWNHGVIADTYLEHQARRFFNYQMIRESLHNRAIKLFDIAGTSFRGYMKIDHIASGRGIEVLNATYEDVFPEKYTIGIPDHKLIVAELACA